MNIFYLAENSMECATYHCDKHMKMILEYGQLLSTAHRVLDGEVYTELSKNNRKIKRWKLDDDREKVLYKATHINHPSNIWVRESSDNYWWLYDLFVHLGHEYRERYGTWHATTVKLQKILGQGFPKNINREKAFTPPTLCMPDEYKENDHVQSYRNYYIRDKSKFATWKNGNIPKWFTKGIKQYKLKTILS